MQIIACVGEIENCVQEVSGETKSALETVLSKRTTIFPTWSQKLVVGHNIYFVIMADCVVSANDGLLTNIEVRDIINSRRKHRKPEVNQPQTDLQSREFVESKVMKYIEESTPNVDNTMELVHECLSTLKKMNLGLTEGELVQIANHIPLRQVELHLVVEECCDRLTEDQISVVLERIASVYSKAVKQPPIEEKMEEQEES